MNAFYYLTSVNTYSNIHYEQGGQSIHFSFELKKNNNHPYFIRLLLLAGQILNVVKETAHYTLSPSREAIPLIRSFFITEVGGEGVGTTLYFLSLYFSYDYFHYSKYFQNLLKT